MLLIAVLPLIISSVLAAECDLNQLQVDLEINEILGLWYQQYIPMLPSSYKCWRYNIEETEEGVILTTKVIKKDTEEEIKFEGKAEIVNGNILQTAYPNGTKELRIVAANPEHFIIIGQCDKENNPVYDISTRNMTLIEADENPFKEALKDLGLNLTTFAKACDDIIAY